MMWRETGHQEAGPLAETNLKICDLCGALNLAENNACFVCAWHGRFERRPEVVRIAMELMQRRHGRLELEQVTDIRAYYAAHGPSLRSRMVRAFLSIRHWLFG